MAKTGYLSNLGRNQMLLLLTCVSFIISGTEAQVSGNDNCTDALPITIGSAVMGSTSLASDDNVTSCGLNNDKDAPGIWYDFTASGLQYLASTCNSADYDTQITVFTGGCGNLTCVGGADDDCAIGLQTELLFTTTPGTNYLIFVHGFNDTTGIFNLTLTEIPTPPNNDCANAVPIAIGSTVAGTVTGATADSVFGCGTNTFSNFMGVWYTFTSVGTQYVASTCNNADYDTQITVFTGDCGNLTCVDGADDAVDFSDTEELTFATTPDTLYFIYIHGFDGFGDGIGNFNLTLSELPPPLNDDYADGIPIAIGSTVEGTTIGATADDVDGCGNNTILSQNLGVWFTFTAIGEEYVASVCNNANFDTQITVFRDDAGSLTCIDGQDDGMGCGFTTELTFATTPGSLYLVFVYGYGDTGDFNLTLEELAETPTKAPTKAPTKLPTESPTSNPTKSPTKSPTASPTESSTMAPTKSPTASPTKSPTASPTKSSTAAPTKSPMAAPSTSPTKSPTGSPTNVPSKVPTKSPTIPTESPTTNGGSTKSLTGSPTASPTDSSTRPHRGGKGRGGKGITYNDEDGDDFGYDDICWIWNLPCRARRFLRSRHDQD